ncbi:MAG: hypothetical protein WBA97_38395 [Actinophytocola sp.]|uniref:hypothetical protein n=1 Tax=Actinophytocola sp. TaxID=1872138 RepID=UPI003C749AD8
MAGITPRAGWRVVPGAVPLLTACVSFLDSHLFWPRGVFTMVAIAVGMFLLSWATAPVSADERRSAPIKSRNR